MLGTQRCVVSALNKLTTQRDVQVERIGPPRKCPKRTRDITRAPEVQYAVDFGFEEWMTWEGLRQDIRDFEFRSSKSNCIWPHGEHFNYDNNTEKMEVGKEKHCI